MPLVSLALAITVAPAASCAKRDGGPTPPWPDASCNPTVLEDLDPDPAIVELDLTAAPADWNPTESLAPPLHGFAYNGIVPGPMIVVDAGDLVRVHFRNDLPMETTVHWHGLRIPDAMDGVPIVMDPVQPGETFEYEFTPTDPGLYWYHPHMSADEAIDKGLYGMFLVRDPAEPAVGCDAAIALDDLVLDSSGQIVSPTSPGDRMTGTLGSTLLANGRVARTLPMKPGGRALLRLVNVANSRYFDLELEGHPMTIVATDGGYIDPPVDVQRLTIAPGERYTVLVRGDGLPGETYALLNHRESIHPGGIDPLGDGPTPVLSLVYGTSPVTEVDPVIPALPLPALVAGTPHHTWVLAETMTTAGTMALTIDGETWPDGPVVTSTAAVTTFAVRNTSVGRHPFHLHGQRFLVEPDGTFPAPPFGWKDSIDVLPGSTVVLMTETTNPGRWMLHCHILEHAEDGMMAELDVQ